MTRAEEMRAAFDAAFAEALAAPTPPHIDLLCFELGGQVRAVRLSDVASLHADLAIVPLPSRSPALLGMAAVRSALVPIFDAGLLAGASAMTKPRYVIVTGTIGLAFDAFRGHVKARDLRDHALLDLAALAAVAMEK
jgi:chemotaxis signal transduction protein